MASSMLDYQFCQFVLWRVQYSAVFWGVFAMGRLILTILLVLVGALGSNPTIAAQDTPRVKGPAFAGSIAWVAYLVPGPGTEPAFRTRFAPTDEATCE